MDPTSFLCLIYRHAKPHKAPQMQKQIARSECKMAYSKKIIQSKYFDTKHNITSTRV